MDQTPNRGYPFPECEPPLVKDASDIIQFRGLAEAVNDDVQAEYDRSDDVLIRPDGVRMSMSAFVAVTAASEIPFYDTMTFDTTGGSMATTLLGVITIVQPGWYMVGTWVDATAAVFQGLRCRFIQNGAPATSFCPQGEITTVNKQYIQYDATCFFEVPGTLGLELRAGAASPSYSYASRIWAQQVIAL